MIFSKIKIDFKKINKNKLFFLKINNQFYL